MSWSEKLEGNVRLGVKIRSKCTTQIKKLDRNIRHGVRNQNEMYDLE